MGRFDYHIYIEKKVGPFWLSCFIGKNLGRFIYHNYVVKKLGRFGNRFGPFWSGPFRIWAVLTIHQWLYGPFCLFWLSPRPVTVWSKLGYWWAPNYRKNSIIGCRFISRTSNADLRNLYRLAYASWEIKAPQKTWSNYDQ